MTGGDEGEVLWRRVTATVRPLHPRRASPPQRVSPIAAPRPAPPRPAAPPPPPPPRPGRPAPGPPPDTLDGGWDRRLRRGIAAPDRTIDLHGHTLATAQAALDQAIALALADDARLLLVVTGRPPRPGHPARGLIRAAIFDWLAQSRHAARIAAVRNAHPRHGGAGALYLILRRRRD